MNIALQQPARQSSEVYPIAAIVCMIGVFMRILLPEPVLSVIDLYGTNDAGAAAYQKIHPGCYFIIASLPVLLWESRKPLQQFLKIIREQTIFMTLLGVYILIFCYWALRDVSGVGMLIDTHIPVPICAIVLSYAPRSYCRRFIYAFITMAALNSTIGIIEGIGKFRVFAFDPEWQVSKELYFRASAFLGHPLDNAMFTSIALLATMSLRLPGIAKTFFLALFLASLVAFGGRAGLAFTLLSLIPLGLIAVRNIMAKGTLKLGHLFLLIAAIMVIPVIMGGTMYELVHSRIGERVASMSSFSDDSAHVRELVFHAYDYMTPEEIFFGVSGDRVIDISYRMGLLLPVSDIENPWVLMSMFLGVVTFPFWLAATAAFVWKLTWRKPLGLQLAVLCYFFIASTSNSFGRKDGIYVIMVAVVICASAMLLDREEFAPPKIPPG